MQSRIERLRTVPRLERVPEKQLAWLATHGRWQRYEPGDILAATGEMFEGMSVILEGHVAGYRREGAIRRKVIEWFPGDLFGILPFSRMTGSPGENTVVAPSELVTVPRDHLPEMVRECYDLAAITVHEMVDRARLFKAFDLHEEKMLSLGKLAAGLAHELNNPVSAIARSAGDLSESLARADESVPSFGELGLSEEQIAWARAALDGCLDVWGTVARSPLEQADREDAIADWLRDHAIDQDVEALLVDSQIDPEWLEKLSDELSGRALEVVVLWLAERCHTRGLALEISDAASRVHTLVEAVKGFTHMDRARTVQPVDLGRGLSDTVTILAGKGRGRRVEVRLVTAEDLPPVVGFEEDLNQVWMNLIDNALDAAPEGGSIDVSATASEGTVEVTVIDGGTGIPEEVLPRIFDPFFTTKPVGEGTGLGLDTVLRLVRGHDGQIDVTTGRGRTEFRVTLPAFETDPAAANAG
jgi:signal transduction histidine kinase